VGRTRPDATVERGGLRPRLDLSRCSTRCRRGQDRGAGGPL